MMLLRLMIAAYRPIPLRMAILLLNARDLIDDQEEDPGDDLEGESEEGFSAWVLGICGIFVTIYDQQLFFIHQTAKEYLQVSNKRYAAISPQKALSFMFRHSISETEAHKVMAENCIALWKLGAKSKINWELEIKKHEEEGGGYRYCLELWAQHFREAQVFLEFVAQRKK